MKFIVSAWMVESARWLSRWIGQGMLFLTYWFVLFMTVAFPLYWFIPVPRVRRLVLLLACAVFHTHFAGPAGVLPIIFLGVITYFAGLSRTRTACYSGIALCAGSLVFYKYTKFICTAMIGKITPQLKTSLLEYQLPISLPSAVLAVSLLAIIVAIAGLKRKTFACGLGIAFGVTTLVFHQHALALITAGFESLPHEIQSSLLQRQSLPSLTAPLAISFFAFEFIHYLMEVSAGGPSIKDPLRFCLFSIFWPSIVAGPVKRYRDFLPALGVGVRSVDSQDVAVGIVRVARGIVKKFAADTLTAWVTHYGPHFSELDILWRWYFVAAISLRILWDFSGYSDMAIGFARMYGIRLPENFNWPYLATSIVSFWHRWHISLSTWIRDYIYIRLGGSRCGTARKIANGLLAFGICGLWHGAGWNFLFWGIYHGVGLAVASNYRTLLGESGEFVAKKLETHRQIGWVMTMLFVGVGWLFFFYPMPEAFKMLRLLFKVG
jgi:alginate O-acetyltransferase complex protein AlgI